MSDFESLPEEISINSSISESIPIVISNKIISDYISNNIPSESLDHQAKFIQKKLLLLKRKEKLSLIPKAHPAKPSEIFTKKISLLNHPPQAKKDPFYELPVREELISKLKFENFLSDLKLDTDFTELELEKKLLLEKTREIELEKFIDAQYYRVKSKW